MSEPNEPHSSNPVLQPPPPDTVSPEPGVGAYRRLMRNRNFRLMWMGQFVSGIGDWLVIGFLIPLVTEMSGGSSFAVAGILVAKIIPALVFSSFIGVLVDRFDRRRVMIVTELSACVISLTLVVANNVWVIYLAVLALETTSLTFWPARNSLIPYLVGEEDVTSANGLAYTTGQASMIIGLTAAASILAGFEAIVHAVLNTHSVWVHRLVGPFAPALVGPRAGVILDSATFLFSAIMIIMMRVNAMPPRKKEKIDFGLVGRDVVESFRFLGEHRELRGLLITIGLAILGGGAIVPVGQTYVVENLTGALPFAERFHTLQRLTATPTTFMLVFMAVGMVAGALIIPRIEHKFRLQVLFGGSVTLFAIALFGFATVNRYAIAGAFAIVAGAMIATVTVAGNSYVVHTTSDELRGRVFTAMESIIRISLLISMVVMAPLSDLLTKLLNQYAVQHHMLPSQLPTTGSRLTLQFASLIVAGAAVYAFYSLRWTEADAITPGETPADV